MDVSIQIVHYNTPGLLRETLRSIRMAAPHIAYEVLVVDNNPEGRLSKEFRGQFPFVRFLDAAEHKGFGGGHNFASSVATGRYIFVFNPDIVVPYGMLEKMVEYLDLHPQISLLGPKLLNPDGSLQLSCFRFDHPSVKVLRRTPLRHLTFVQRLLDRHLMLDADHDTTQTVDWLLGACLLVRRDVWDALRGFDERFLLYFEDMDFCRRVWEIGGRVVYHPSVFMVHYHRREGSQGSLFVQVFQRANRLHIRSFLKYVRKYFRKPFPCR